ncbi:TRAP transporter large permease [Halobellus marinus]|uniref:TRAP transporter large permease n=1 Tax=Halobellus TaxID=1073986 RepID=UPI0028AD5AC7|nr:TRAP transporter large permease [Halobellus sp. DFY28]
MILQLLSTGEILLLATVLCVILFFIGIPIYLVFGAWGLVYHATSGSFPISNIALEHYDVLQTFPFTAIPLFILVGDLIYESGIAAEVVDFTKETIGWWPGSTGNTAIGTAAIFSAITGSNAATTASVGNALYPQMEEEGYKDTYAAGTIAAGGVLGAIIPPSILLIIYGVAFGVSIVELFKAGIAPGIAMLVVLIGINTYYSKKESYGSQTALGIDPGKVTKAAWNAKIGIGTIAILLGGIFAGIFTPTESAAVAVIYILALAVGTGRISSWGQIMRASFSSLLLLGVIIPMVVTSVLIQQSMSNMGLQTVIANAVIGLENQLLILVAILAVIWIAGTVMDATPNLLLTAPMLAPAAAEIGWGPVVWGMIFMMGDSVGFITPPYGLNLYIISGIAELDYIRVARAVVPYLLGLVAIWIGYALIHLYI